MCERERERERAVGFGEKGVRLVREPFGVLLKRCWLFSKFLALRKAGLFLSNDWASPPEHETVNIDGADVFLW